MLFCTCTLYIYIIPNCYSFNNNKIIMYMYIVHVHVSVNYGILISDNINLIHQACHEEWNPPDDLANELPLPPNPILSHIVYRLLDMVDPPKPPPTPPKFPKSLVRASFIGKPFTGKSTSLQRLEAEYNVVVLSVEGVLTKAVETFFAEKKKYDRQGSHNEENVIEDAPVISGEDDQKDADVPTITFEPSSSVDINVSSTGTSTSTSKSQKTEGKREKDISAESAVPVPQEREVTEEMLEHFSPMAKLGYKAHTAMACGETLDDQTAVEIFVEEIKQLPEGNCWVMDNFPVSQEQAKVREYMYLRMSVSSLPISLPIIIYIESLSILVHFLPIYIFV